MGNGRRNILLLPVVRKETLIGVSLKSEHEGNVEITRRRISVETDSPDIAL